MGQSALQHPITDKQQHLALSTPMVPKPSAACPELLPAPSFNHLSSTPHSGVRRLPVPTTHTCPMDLPPPQLCDTSCPSTGVTTTNSVNGQPQACVRGKKIFSPPVQRLEPLAPDLIVPSSGTPLQMDATTMQYVSYPVCAILYSHPYGSMPEQTLGCPLMQRAMVSAGFPFAPFPFFCDACRPRCIYPVSIACIL